MGGSDDALSREGRHRHRRGGRDRPCYGQAPRVRGRARVIIADLRGDAAEHSAAEVRQAGASDALGMACDVSSEAQVAATVKAAMDRFGRLDVVVNNAGLMTFKS